MTHDDVGRVDADASGSPDGTVFRGRATLYHGEVTCRLGQDGMTVERQGRVDSIAYRDVLSIRRCEVARSARGPARMTQRCLVTASAASFFVQSADFRGWGRFDDKTVAYEAFVRALSERVATANPDAVFLEGMTVWSWRGWMFTLVMCILLGLTGLFLMPQGLALTLVCAASLPTTLAMIRQGPARRVPAPRLPLR